MFISPSFPSSFGPSIGLIHFTPFCKLSVVHFTVIFCLLLLESISCPKIVLLREDSCFFEVLYSVERRGNPCFTFTFLYCQNKTCTKNNTLKEFWESFQAEKERLEVGVICYRNYSVKIEHQKTLQTKYAEHSIKVITKFCLAVIMSSIILAYSIGR